MERASVTESDGCEGREIEDIKLYVHVYVTAYQTTKVARYGILLRVL
jgi:hypothetical protein